MGTTEKILGRVLNRHNTTAEWNKKSSIIPEGGELIIYDPDDTYNYPRLKFGDGKKTLSALPFLGEAELSSIQNEMRSPSSGLNIANDQVLVPQGNWQWASPIPKFLWHDLLAFREAIISYSIDGNTWLSYEANDKDNFKRNLTNQKESQTLTILDDSKPYIRFEWIPSASATWHACQAEWLIIGYTWQSSQASCRIQFQMTADGTTWTDVLDTTVISSQKPVWYKLNSNWANCKGVRLIFSKTSPKDTKTLGISSVRWLTSRWGDQGFGSELEKPYGWDNNANILPRNITSSLGTSSSYWDGIYTNNLVLPNQGFIKKYIDSNVSESYTYTLPNKTGTLALTEDIPIDYIKIEIASGTSTTSGKFTQEQLATIKTNPHKIVLIWGGFCCFAENLSSNTTWYYSANTTFGASSIDKKVIEITMASGDWKYTGYTYTDQDSHYITGLYIGTTGTKANAATSNGNTYIKLYDDDTKRSEFSIKGTGATTVTSDANGNLIVDSKNTNTWREIKVGNVSKLDTTTSTALNFAAGNNANITYDNGTITFSATNTKNTAGATNSDNKLFLIGATSQATSSETYSDAEVYTTNGTLTVTKMQIGGGTVTLQYDTTKKALKFVF